MGLYILNCFQMDIRSNVVRRASAIGMALDGQHLQVVDNDISDCGIGLSRFSGTTTLISNKIVRTSSIGAHFYAPEVLDAERNIVGRSGSAAVFVEFPSLSSLRFTQNTFYKANGSGILIGEGDATLTAVGNMALP